MSTDIAAPVKPGEVAFINVHHAEGLEQEVSGDTAAIEGGMNDEMNGTQESHADLDAYRNSRRLSRPDSRLRHSFSPARSRSEGESSAIPQKAENKDDKHQGAPLCMVAYTHRIESCTQSIQAWSDRQEVKAEKRKASKAKACVVIKEDGTIIEPKGETWIQSHIVIIMVGIILSWIYIVFVWRICVAGIRVEPRAVITRSEGIGLLVGFNLLWLITIWTYIRVILTPPGFVRDHVPISSPPGAPSEIYRAPILYPGAGNASEEQQRPSMQEEAIVSIDSKVARQEETLDPSLPAIIGPLGAGQVAKADEEKAIMSQHNIAATDPTPWANTKPIEENNTGKYSNPEPLRGPCPSDLPPLHPSNQYCYRCKRIRPPRAHHCRRCATCVLQMDHHCPWVGGCVGARNHKYFYHFLQWVTALEYFVLVVDAIVFSRGIKRRSNGTEPGWSIDGYLISMFPICVIFILFTTPLLITHSYLFLLNLTTIEHMAYDRMQTREDILLSSYLDSCKNQNGEKLRYNERRKEKRRIRSKWFQQWGNLKSEANLWWVDDRNKALKRGDQNKKTTWYHSIGPNWKQAVGDAWYDSLFPIGRAKSDGLSFERNWRFEEDGSWRQRKEWQAKE